MSRIVQQHENKKNDFSSVCAAKNSRAKELNCVYKSDNCWETKSFMVEFLTLYFPFFLSKESFLCDFSHNIVTEKHNFLFACDMMVGKEETRKIISDGEEKLVSFLVEFRSEFTVNVTVSHRHDFENFQRTSICLSIKLRFTHEKKNTFMELSQKRFSSHLIPELLSPVLPSLMLSDDVTCGMQRRKPEEKKVCRWIKL